MATQALMTVDAISRRFGSVQALDQVSMYFGAGEVVGLIGENGAGKSTLLNIICGVDRPDSGSIDLRGTPWEPRDYHDASRHGVFRIFQDLSLVPTATVYENLYLTHEAHFQSYGILRRGKMRTQAAEVLERFGHGWIDPRREARSYPFSTRQVIEIVKSFALAELLHVKTPLILLDEPTTGLSESEVQFFYELVGGVREHAGVVFVSHRLQELLTLSDRVYVLKDGRMVGERDPANTDERELHKIMVGREREASLYRENLQLKPARDDTALRVANLEQQGEFAPTSFALHRGEILGIAGVSGSGKSEFARCLFGDAKRTGGLIEVSGQPVTRHNIRAMINAGVGYISPDRAEGVIPSASVMTNVSLAQIASPRRRRMLPARAERQAAQQEIDRFTIRTPSHRTQTGLLSGGNQQKAILARWITAEVRVLILDNPTAGIDVGAREDIYEILRSFAKSGGAILLVSDDLPELIGLSNRVLPMKDGRVTAEIVAEPFAKPRESDVLRHMV